MNSKNLLSFQQALMRQYSGATFIIVYAKQVMKEMGISPIQLQSSSIRSKWQQALWECFW